MIFDRPLRLTDFKFKEVGGTTHGTANTKQMFRHGGEQVPIFWLPLTGNVYVGDQGLTPNEIDVRSPLTSQPFRILIFY